MDSQHLTPLNLVSLLAKHKVMEDKHRWHNGRDSTSGRANIRRIVSPHRRSKVITWSETVHCVHVFTWKSWRADRSPSLHETEAFWLPVQQRWSLCSTRQSGWNTEGNPGEPPERGTTASQPGQHKRVGGMRIGPLTTVMVVNAYRCKWKTSLWQKGTNKQKTCILLAAFEFWDIYKTVVSVRDASHLVGVDSDRDAEGPSQTKVRQFDDSFVVNQQVLWFQVTVEDSATVAEQNALQDLIKVTLPGQRNSATQSHVCKKSIHTCRDSPSPA